MPRFEPFRALRYASSEPLDDVTAPPYDVISADDVDRLLAAHPHNIVAIDVPRQQAGRDCYAEAGEQLTTWIADGVLVVDAQPSFTLYRMAFVDESGRHRTTVGVIGALEVVDENAGGVLPHERTTPKAKTDRLDLTRHTLANLSPVWGLSLQSALSDLLLDPGEVLGSCIDEHGVTHQVERLTDAETVAAIGVAVSGSDVLIADGHHRYAISRTFRDEVRQQTGSSTTDAELTMTYVAELVDEQLSIDAIHRLYRDISFDDLVSRLGDFFDLSESGPVTSAFAGGVVEHQALCLVHPSGAGSWMLPKHNRFEGVRRLDGAYLEHALEGLDVEVTYQHGVLNAVDEVVGGRAVAAVLIRPTSIDEIRRTAVEGLLMPPKSTFFTPKLRTGLVIRPLDLQSST